jgi:hypothetical protein
LFSVLQVCLPCPGLTEQFQPAKPASCLSLLLCERSSPSTAASGQEFPNTLMVNKAGEKPEYPVSHPPAKRPFLVTLPTALVLIMTSANLMRFAGSLSQWEFLSTLPRMSPVYLAVSGLIWTLVGLPLMWGLWRGHPQAPKATRIIALAYTAYYWLDRALLQSDPPNRSNWVFMAGLTILLLVAVFWTFSRPAAKAFFGEIHDRQFQDSRTA